VRRSETKPSPGVVEPADLKVLVKEKIAESGVELLRRDFDVELGLDWTDEQLRERIGDFDALIVRSATKVTADLIAAAPSLRVVGRAGTGVDNVDLEAATKRGILVVNAPESNSVAAAEHTLALALALCRNVPQAHAALVDGDWARSRYGGNELYGKTLGVIGFGRIGQLVARRALAFDMHVVAFDKFVSAERFRELGVEGVETTEELYERADIITLHLPKTPDTVNWIDATALTRMKDGVRIVNCARGELIDLEALAAALDSGKVAGAALDVFPAEPTTQHPLFGRDDVVVTPHLGASTAEAQDRAGTDTAEQVRAALTGGVVTNAVNLGAPLPEAVAPFVSLCEDLAALAQGLARGPVDRVEGEFRGRIAEHDTRVLGIAVLAGVLRGHTEEPVNLVNASALADERGIELTEIKDSTSADFTELITVRVGHGADAIEVSGTGVGPRNVPYLVGVWGQSFYLPLAEHLAVFRYSDQPGMIGRVGTAFGEDGVNIVSAAVGAEANGGQAVMVLTTDAPVPPATVERILELGGFAEGRAIDLG
jgi:D-3-phosphoglycerate dehydrogenase / 2-oxoglutarate reductase